MKYIGCSLEEAVCMVRTNPTKIFGLNDIGEIELKKANLIMITIDHQQLQIEKTIVAGKLYIRALK